uniref:RRM domain-containing protein n=1 Tax=Kalanchoe fedtschenkoi TaxID=63787 RepID=A0A7N1A423_KALFE
MDSDQGKLFIGGISWETTEEKLKEHFENYGEVSHTVVMRDKETGRPRGFGFVCFADPSVLDRVLQDTHNIDGRTVEAKRAMSREEQQVTRSSNPNPTRGYGSGGSVKTKKIFVGGLPATLTEEGFREYFETYGHVTDVVVMYDQNTQRPRGFGFISFDSEDAVDRVLHKNFHDLNGKQVEVKRALPKDANVGGSGHSVGGSAGGGGGYPGYGSSGGNQNAYGGRMDPHRYMPTQSAAGGFPPYGSSGFNASGYGYGPASNGLSYGAYGPYGGANPGYGGPAVAAAAYGNPGVPSSGYAGGPPGATSNSWGGQGASGYGAVGYGNASSWVAPSPGNAPGSGGPGSAPTGQSSNGTSAYGTQGYGYGGYGGGDGSYSNAGAYGVVGGRSGGAPSGSVGGSEMQGSGGYMGTGYNDAGYGNVGWRADPSLAVGNYGAQPGPQGGYGSGYGGAPTRQPQQQ